MKMSKKLLLSALAATTLCRSGVSAVPHLSNGAVAGIVGGTLSTCLVVGTGIALGCSGSKKNDVPEQVSIPADKPEDFVPSIFDYDVVSKEMLYDQLWSGNDLEKFIVDSVGGKEKFGVLEKFFGKLYCHGSIKKEEFKNSKIFMMSFETRDQSARYIRKILSDNVAQFFSKNESKEKVDFALYAVARCLDPFYCNMTYKKLCKVARKNYVGFEFRIDKDFEHTKDEICSVFVNKQFIELRYQSDSRAFNCIFALD